MERKGRVVLVAVDLGTHHGDAVLAALDLEGANANSEIHLLNVLDASTLHDRSDKRVFEQEEEFLARTPRLLRDRASDCFLMHARPRPHAAMLEHARIGPVVPTILQACVDYDADILICGTHARAGVSRVLLGSVAESLIREAQCPVLVARRKAYEGKLRTPVPDPPLAQGETAARALASRTEQLVTSTTMDSWEPANAGPTGVRIV